MKQISLGDSGYFAMCDDKDFEFLSCFRWYLLKGKRGIYYAHGLISESSEKNKRPRMHRLIINPPQGMIVDHINSNGLDNRRRNLRVCTNQQNIQNQRILRGGSSKYKGVTWDKENRKWRASIVVDSRRLALGRFHNEIDAANAYDEAALKHFREFAYTNFKDKIWQ